MPCRVEPIDIPARVRSDAQATMMEANDLASALTFAADVLREEILGETPEDFQERVLETCKETPELLSSGQRLYNRLDSLHNKTQNYDGDTPSTESGTLREHLGRIRELHANLSDAWGFIQRIQDGGTLSRSENLRILASQIEHREEDLRRLQHTFTDLMYGTTNETERQEYRELLKRCLEADPENGLYSQLGFDADEY